MINACLDYVRMVLDQYLEKRLGLESGIVVLNNLVDQDGSSLPKNKNKIVVTLVNIEYETNKQFYGAQRRDADQISRVNPSVCFNLDILISSNFDDYAESLKFLTAVIQFFQDNISFNRTNSPTLPEEISMLKIEIENTPSGKTHNLWTALGAKYLPSIVYKIRHVNVESGQIKGISAPIKDTTVKVAP